MRNLVKFFPILFLILPHSVFSAETFSLHTSSFKPNQPIPVLYTCDGKNVSPELDWSALPEKTKSLALFFTDISTADTFYHWVLYNIPTEVLSFSEGVMDDIKNLPAGVKVAKNSLNKQAYYGPCPPKGETHRYKFTLYAVDTLPSIADDADAATVMHAIENHILGSVTIDTTYKRP